ncbi:MAG: hypothetical protein U9R39_06550 [Campylobacterota bacterium]|nr:hypothetical protein [Campylobacterota bacterium]
MTRVENIKYVNNLRKKDTLKKIYEVIRKLKKEEYKEYSNLQLVKDCGLCRQTVSKYIDPKFFGKKNHDADDIGIKRWIEETEFILSIIIFKKC